MTSRRVAAIGLCLCADGALAESSTLNLHFEPAAATFIAPPQSALFGVGEDFALRADLPFAGPLAGQLGASLVNVPAEPGSFNEPGRAFAFGAGIRWRALDDHEGYLVHFGDKAGHRGNLLGNLWVDVEANLVGTGPLLRFGFEAGAGLELSLLDELQVGPFIRYVQIVEPALAGFDPSPARLFLAGLSLSLGFPGTAVHAAR